MIGSFINLLICMTRVDGNSKVYLVSPEFARISKRNFNLYLRLATNLLKYNKVNFELIKPTEIKGIVQKSTAQQFFLEMGYFYLLSEIIDAKSEHKRKAEIPEFIAINSGVDLFMSTASYFRNVLFPRKIIAIYRWKRGTNKVLRNHSWLIPVISKKEIFIAKKKTYQVKHNEASKVFNNLFKNIEIREEFNKIRFRNSKFIILALGVPADINYLENLSSMYKNVANHQFVQYLVKPHPNIELNIKQLKTLEELIGYPSCNIAGKKNLEIMRTIPLESILSYFPNSIYVGFFTGGINFIEPSRVYWVNSGDRKIDKMNKIYYSEYVKLWKSNYT
jgi:hypothetical protein